LFCFLTDLFSFSVPIFLARYFPSDLLFLWEFPKLITLRKMDEDNESDNNEDRKDRSLSRSKSPEPEEGIIENRSEDNANTKEISNDDSASKQAESCCKECTRDNRRNGRSCICQVPSAQRRNPLGKEGCVTCHCTGKLLEIDY
jgi:hypothetical protein